MQTEKTAPLLLLPVNSLLDRHFFILSYQRGYRWTVTQVTDLLEDILSFTPPPVSQGEKKETYCLQPIVVRNIGSEENPLWEVIDGQQRLTTIKILLEYLHSLAPDWVEKPFSLEYATRTRKEKNSVDYFADMADPASAAKNIDAFHIHAAYSTIVTWFENKKKILSNFHSKVINETSVIWYDVAAINDVSDTTTPIDIFTRLNIGKIALTNAELIKARFMQRNNFAEDDIDAMQIQIASEWDSIEKKLQNDELWFFIYNPPKMETSLSHSSYDTKFEYIFDLMMKKKNDDEQYTTFVRFNAQFKNKGKTPADVLILWRDVKDYFLRIEEWYEDHELYHLIGFLITCGVPLQMIYENSLVDQDAFRDFLKKKIKDLFTKPLEKIDYNDRKNAKNSLLLFNILTINSEKSITRFPFSRYKNGEWDIEHVRSQAEKTIDKSTWRSWAEDILDLFSGYAEAVNNPEVPGNGKRKKIYETLLQLWEKEEVDFEDVMAVYEKVLHLYGEDLPVEDINSMANLALLDAGTNRSYQNAIFPVKRKTIVENEMRGVFTPVCTKNLFMKFYSKGDTDIMRWGAADADAYQEAMSRCLEDYLPREEPSHD